MKAYLQKNGYTRKSPKNLKTQTEARLKRNKTEVSTKNANVHPVEMPKRIESASTNQFESGNQEALQPRIAYMPEQTSSQRELYNSAEVFGDD